MKKQRVVIMMMLVCALLVTSVPAFAADSCKWEKNQLTVKEQKQLFQDLERQPVYIDKGESNSKTSRHKVSAASRSKYPTRKGVILVTKDTVYKIASMVGHAAIVYSKTKVIEGTIDGVKKGNNNWKKKKSCWAGTVRKTTAKQDAAAANWCSRQIGKPYNYRFFDVQRRDKFYCSQLIYAAFLDKCKVNLNYRGAIVYPADLLRDPSKTKITYKKGRI